MFLFRVMGPSVTLIPEYIISVPCSTSNRIKFAVVLKKQLPKWKSAESTQSFHTPYTQITGHPMAFGLGWRSRRNAETNAVCPDLRKLQNRETNLTFLWVWKVFSSEKFKRSSGVSAGRFCVVDHGTDGYSASVVARLRFGGNQPSWHYWVQLFATTGHEELRFHGNWFPLFGTLTSNLVFCFRGSFQPRFAWYNVYTVIMLQQSTTTVPLQ